MRFSIAYYLVLLYTTVMFQPLIPLVQDAFSHTFAEAYHIATVHMKYGNDHLEKELAKSSEGENKNQHSVKQSEIFVAHIPSKNIDSQSVKLSIKIFYANLNTVKLLKVWLYVLVPPPKNLFS